MMQKGAGVSRHTRYGRQQANSLDLFGPSKSGRRTVKRYLKWRRMRLEACAKSKLEVVSGRGIVAPGFARVVKWQTRQT